MRLYRINLLIEAVERKRERKEACLLQTSLSLTNAVDEGYKKIFYLCFL